MITELEYVVQAVAISGIKFKACRRFAYISLSKLNKSSQPNRRLHSRGIAMANNRVWHNVRQHDEITNPKPNLIRYHQACIQRTSCAAYQGCRLSGKSNESHRFFNESMCSDQGKKRGLVEHVRNSWNTTKLGFDASNPMKHVRLAAGDLQQCEEVLVCLSSLSVICCISHSFKCCWCWNQSRCSTAITVFSQSTVLLTNMIVCTDLPHAQVHGHKSSAGFTDWSARFDCFCVLQFFLRTWC